MLRRLVARIRRDPFAVAVSCGECWAWVPGGSFDQHIDWHRRSAEAVKIGSDYTAEMIRAQNEAA